MNEFPKKKKNHLVYNVKRLEKTIIILDLQSLSISKINNHKFFKLENFVLKAFTNF